MSNEGINLKTIAIDIGHNVSFDGGAVGIRKEDELNKLVGETLIENLSAIGINVVNCTPKSAISLYDSLNKRCISANTGHADFFISIHHNAVGVKVQKYYVMVEELQKMWERRYLMS